MNLNSGEFMHGSVDSIRMAYEFANSFKIHLHSSIFEKLLTMPY